MIEEFWRIIEKLTACHNAKIIKNEDETDFYLSIMNHAKIIIGYSNLKTTMKL